MDALTISLLAIAASLAGALLATATGLVAPQLSARLKVRTDKYAFIWEQRRDAYIEFAAAVERAQRKADADASGTSSTPFTIKDIDDVEFARVRIDIFGTHAAKRWAYRCTISLQGLLYSLVNTRGESPLTRAKLHDARKTLIIVMRYELGVSNLERGDQISRKESRAARHEIVSLARNQTNVDHYAWMAQEPSDESALSAGAEAVEVHRRAVAAVFHAPNDVVDDDHHAARPSANPSSSSRTDADSG